MSKSWRFAADSAEVRWALEPFAKCLGGHPHAVAQGQETEKTGYYPKELCRRILRATRKDETRPGDLSKEAAAYAAEDNGEEEKPEDTAETSEPPPDTEPPDTELTPEEAKKIDGYLSLVHVNLGHPIEQDLAEDPKEQRRGSSRAEESKEFQV